MVNKYFEGIVPNRPAELTELDKELEKFTDEKIKAVETELDAAHASNSLEELWQIISRTNKYIDETMPWVLFKEERTEELSDVMYHLVENLRKIAILIRPYMEETSDKMFSQLGITDENLMTWDSAKTYPQLPEGLKVVQKGEPLFVRLDLNEEVEFLKAEMQK